MGLPVLRILRLGARGRELMLIEVRENRDDSGAPSLNFLQFLHKGPSCSARLARVLR
jgi:hypothetical protein